MFKKACCSSADAYAVFFPLSLNCHLPLFLACLPLLFYQIYLLGAQSPALWTDCQSLGANAVLTHHPAELCVCLCVPVYILWCVWEERTFEACIIFPADKYENAWQLCPYSSINHLCSIHIHTHRENTHMHASWERGNMLMGCQVIYYPI